MIDYLTMLADLGAVHTDGHFVYASTRWDMHGQTYIDKRAIVNVGDLRQLCDELGARLDAVDHGIDAIVAPAVGAIGFGVLVADAKHGSHGSDMSFFTAEKDGDTFVVKTRPELLAGKRVAVVRPGRWWTSFGNSVQRSSQSRHSSTAAV